MTFESLLLESLNKVLAARSWAMVHDIAGNYMYSPLDRYARQPLGLKSSSGLKGLSVIA